MIKSEKLSIKIAKFTKSLMPLTDPDSHRMLMYLNKACNCVVSEAELDEYCSPEFKQYLGRATIDPTRVYPLSSLKKEEFYDMYYFHKGVNLL